jgi:hypothetical protein
MVNTIPAIQSKTEYGKLMDIAIDDPAGISNLVTAQRASGISNDALDRREEQLDERESHRRKMGINNGDFFPRQR